MEREGLVDMVGYGKLFKVQEIISHSKPTLLKPSLWPTPVNHYSSETVSGTGVARGEKEIEEKKK